MTGSGSPQERSVPSVPRIPGVDTADMIAGRYRVEKVLGAGSSGFVVAARHVYLRRPVTLKILPLTTSTHERAQRRHLAVAHRAAALRGPHVARIIDTGFADDGTPFVATERLEGHTLADELGVRGPLSAAQAVRFVLQACEGLAEAHAAGIVHGDLKPENLFLVGQAPSPGEADSRIVKVLDFGMTTPMDDKAEGSAAWFGSPVYLSPEQIRDPDAIDARTDIWALGVILHQLIAGALPFSAETISGMLVAVACDKPGMLVGPDVSFDLARVVHACLAKEPTERPSDVAELAQQLAPFAGAEGQPLALRVEEMLAAPPPPMDMSDDSGVASMARSVPPPSAEDTIVRRRPVAKIDERADKARVRRRRGAIGAVAAAALLALVGFLAPEPDAKRAAKSRDGETTLTSGVVEEGAPLPNALFVLSDKLPEARAAVEAPPPAPPVATHVPAASPKPASASTSSSRREPAASNSALRGSLRAPAPPTKGRPGLSVRDDPYGKPAAARGIPEKAPASRGGPPPTPPSMERRK